MTRDFFILRYKQLSIACLSFLFGMSFIINSSADNALGGSVSLNSKKTHSHKKNTPYFLPNLDGSAYFPQHTQDSTIANADRSPKQRESHKQRLKNQINKHIKWSLLDDQTENGSRSLSVNLIKQELVGKIQQGNLNYYLKASEKKAVLSAKYRF